MALDNAACTFPLQATDRPTPITHVHLITDVHAVSRTHTSRCFLRSQRETEEGRRRRQQQQQQQADSTSALTKTDSITPTTADGGSAPTQQLARSPAPGADHAVVAGGIGGNEGRVKAPENQQQGPRVSKEEEDKGRCSGNEESDERSHERSEQPFSTHNGGECRDGLYAWNQSIYEARPHHSSSCRVAPVVASSSRSSSTRCSEVLLQNMVHLGVKAMCFT